MTPGMRLRELMIVALVILCLLGAWVAQISTIMTADSILNSDGNVVQVSNKSPIYYLAHGLSIFSGLIAGILCMLNGRFVILDPVSRFAFFILFLTAGLWAWVSYTPQEIRSTAIFGATGPFVWFIVLLVLAGTLDLVWIVLTPMLRVLSYATAVLAFREILVSPFVLYQGFNKHIGYALLLIWLAGSNLLHAKNMKGWRLYISFIPFGSLLLTAIYSLSRSWTLLSFLLLIAFALLRARNQHRPILKLKTGIAMVLALSLAIAAFYLFMPGSVNIRMKALNQRLMDDTRTSQYVAFFRAVPKQSLILGSGPKGTWYWPGAGEYQFFDNGYLWILFVGGMPTLLCYITIVLLPAFRLLPNMPSGNDANAVALLLFWSLMLAGLSTFILPGTAFPNLLVLLWAGRCHRLISERKRVSQTVHPVLGIKTEAISI